MSFALALALSLPLAAETQVKNLTLTGVGSGSVLHQEGCPNDAFHACWAVLLENVAGTGAFGGQVGPGDLLFTFSSSQSEAQRDLTDIAIFLGKLKDDSRKVTLGLVEYDAGLSGLSQWTGRKGDKRPVHTAKVTIAVETDNGTSKSTHTLGSL
jgi:hypothetical protein